MSQQPRAAPDWAEIEAREWLQDNFLSTYWNYKHIDKLAALLRRVRGEAWDAAKAKASK